MLSMTGYATARKASAFNLQCARKWFKRRHKFYALDCALRAGWWKSRSEEYAKKMFWEWDAEF
jgi:hypothetical protein